MKPSACSITFDDMNYQFEHFEISCCYRLPDW